TKPGSTRSGPAPSPACGGGLGWGRPCIHGFRHHCCCMHLDSPDAPADAKAQHAADRRRLGNAFKASLGFVLLLVIVFGSQGMIDWRPFAVAPWSLSGLVGVLTAPLLHGSPAHLVANA